MPYYAGIMTYRRDFSSTTNIKSTELGTAQKQAGVSFSACGLPGLRRSGAAGGLAQAFRVFDRPAVLPRLGPRVLPCVPPSMRVKCTLYIVPCMQRVLIVDGASYKVQCFLQSVVIMSCF